MEVLAKQLDPKWDKFLAIANNSRKFKLRYIFALETVIRYWGLDIV